ncbi:MAG TPA: pitrilysin family protein [Thermoanaerobaculia bacterium]|nr:pitrilysin family protein [Thermoanaerobaculia bacterium]
MPSLPPTSISRPSRPLRPPIDRLVPPVPGEIHSFRFPAYLKRRLDNGLTVYTARLPGVPLVSVELVIPAGAQHDPPGRGGLGTLTASLLDEGTQGKNALEIAAYVEELGGYLTTGADWDEGYLATGLLAQHRRQGLSLLAEVLTSPIFPEREIERLRRQRLAEILRRSYDPSSQADDRLTREIYRGTVYASSLLGDEASVSSLTKDEIESFYRSHYAASGSALIAVGDLDPEALLDEVEALFGGVAGWAPPPSPEIRPAPLPGINVHIVDRPGAAQTELRLGHVGVSRKDPDFIPLAVMNALLGGKFTSRINLNLRERHGYTYGASTRFVGRLGPGPFLAGAAVATESTGAAVREILSELARIRDEPVGEDELADTRSYLMGVFPYTVQTIGDLAKRLEILAVYGLPDDYYDGYVARMEAVTREDVQRVAQGHLDPDHLAVVAVGPAEVLEPQLAGLGTLQVWSRSEPAPAGG